jgi:hypothetical protein
MSVFSISKATAISRWATAVRPSVCVSYGRRRSRQTFRRKKIFRQSRSLSPEGSQLATGYLKEPSRVRLNAY